MSAFIVLLLCCLAGATVVYGQELSDLINQKGKQIKELKDQIAELLLFKAALEKGYEIARDGTRGIYMIKQSDFGLHQDHIDSLEIVKPAVSQDGKVAETRELIEDIRFGLTQIESVGLFNRGAKPELYAFTSSFCMHTRSGCTSDSTLLDALLANGQLSMNDGERLRKLDALYERVYNRFLAVVQLEGSLESLARIKH